jgi:hypothetical protein
MASSFALSSPGKFGDCRGAVRLVETPDRDWFSVAAHGEENLAFQ